MQMLLANEFESKRRLPLAKLLLTSLQAQNEVVSINALEGHMRPTLESQNVGVHYGVELHILIVSRI